MDRAGTSGRVVRDGRTRTASAGPWARPMLHSRVVGNTRTVPWPDRLGDYRILGCIGEGGMGVVYEAVRESLKSRVALKVMHPRFRSSAGYLKRFHNEARSAAQLHHTNIVSVFDYGEHDGVCYYAMQYIAGHSLHEILTDVRRLRSSPVRGLPTPLEAQADPTADPSSALALPFREAADTGVQADPLLQTVTRRLLTGQFAAGSGTTVDHEDSPASVTEPLAATSVASVRPRHELGFGIGTPRATVEPRGRGDLQNQSDPASGSSSSSLASQGEDRYHREVARLGAKSTTPWPTPHQRGCCTAISSPRTSSWTLWAMRG